MHSARVRVLVSDRAVSKEDEKIREKLQTLIEIFPPNPEHRSQE